MLERASFGIKPDKPLVVFVGRSNVGKSTVIRALTGAKVRVGKRPGTTRREVMIDAGSVTIVDFPGFGHMTGQSKKSIEKTKSDIVESLERWSKRIVLSVLVIDIAMFPQLVERWESRGEIPIDLEFYDFLLEVSRAVLIVANKTDKIGRADLTEAVALLRERTKKAAGQEPLIIETDASRRLGLDRLKIAIEDVLRCQAIALPTW
ncbi:MAG: GTP-binding protein EngB [Candidatus Thorarchaeota archaeon]|nr:GTP-binding protein EngB [Candidatus Thorarchaeota archaeon]